MQLSTAIDGCTDLELPLEPSTLAAVCGHLEVMLSESDGVENEQVRESVPAALQLGASLVREDSFHC